eukprot:GEMP01019035.1.p1 GENE.GEMP01019035.1~~GEMP01019035.1.p1  ORF type:complete len:606 (+),score=108.95 GEMP01019035.1:90-1907(+)
MRSWDSWSSAFFFSPRANGQDGQTVTMRTSSPDFHAPPANCPPPLSWTDPPLSPTRSSSSAPRNDDGAPAPDCPSLESNSRTSTCLRSASPDFLTKSETSGCTSSFGPPSRVSEEDMAEAGNGPHAHASLVRRCSLESLESTASVTNGQPASPQSNSQSSDSVVERSVTLDSRSGASQREVEQMEVEQADGIADLRNTLATGSSCSGEASHKAEKQTWQEWRATREIQEIQESRSTAFKCHDCEDVFYSESDAYNHSYPDNAFVGGHTWMQVRRKYCHRGLHIIRWGGPKNESYFLKGEHAITVGKSRVAYMSTKGHVVVEAWQKFIGSDPVYLQAYNSDTRLPHDEVAERAMAAVGKVGYHAFFMNSEHFATWACLGSKRSKELWGVGAIAGTVSFSSQLAVFALAGPLALLVFHGAIDVVKVAAASILAKDCAARQWDDIASTFGNPKCCQCGQYGSLTSWDDVEIPRSERENLNDGSLRRFFSEFQAGSVTRGSPSEERDHLSDALDAAEIMSEPEMCTTLPGKRRYLPRSHRENSGDSARKVEVAVEARDVELCTNVYSICSAGHTACLNCVRRLHPKPFLCMRDDCFEVLDGPPDTVFVP